jgi:hypothetical protein
MNYEVVPYNHNQYLPPQLMGLVQRHNPTMTDEFLIQHDSMIKQVHLQPKTVMMYEFELDEVEKAHGADAGLTLKFKGLDFVEPIMKQCNATKLEDVLWFFETPRAALEAALKITAKLKEYNKTHTALTERISITGFGIHKGEILYYAGTDVHWGDPVNTSSKLG